MGLSRRWYRNTCQIPAKINMWIGGILETLQAHLPWFPVKLKGIKHRRNLILVLLAGVERESVSQLSQIPITFLLDTATTRSNGQWEAAEEESPYEALPDELSRVRWVHPRIEGERRRRPSPFQGGQRGNSSSMNGGQKTDPSLTLQQFPSAAMVESNFFLLPVLGFAVRSAWHFLHLAHTIRSSHKSFLLSLWLASTVCRSSSFHAWWLLRTTRCFRDASARNAAVITAHYMHSLLYSD